MRFLIIGVILVLSFVGKSQYSSLRSAFIPPLQDSLLLDSLSIYPASINIVNAKGEKIESIRYDINHLSNTLYLDSTSTDTLWVTYRVLPFDLSIDYQRRDTSMLYVASKGNLEKFIYKDQTIQIDPFNGSNLERSGSISRGISFGNNQNLAVNSAMNLELNGELAPNLKILASVSDDNMPIQADGNTNKLQEFDQVFIQIYNQQFKIIAGDFWLKKPPGYFMTYKKRAQGLTAEYNFGKDTLHQWKTQASGALSKGKFARQIIQGVEGNQGPYRLKGNENEPYIIILAGTENVYIDGKLMERGQDFDYTINYNSAEIIFTARNLITKDSRIVVEFQYSDQNYARSLLQSSMSYSGPKLNFWINSYTEQDAKNQPIQQELSTSQKQLLYMVGDSLHLANTSSIDSVGFFENQNLYKLIDSLGYDSVLVFSINPDSAYYRAVFQFVGSGKGDYVFSHFNALGKVFKWVSPVAGVSQGDYQPAKLLLAPKKKQMIASGYNYQLNKYWKIENEFAITQNDINTFSPKDQEDDVGYSTKTRISREKPLGKDSSLWKLKTSIDIETLDANFSPIEQYRSVEFDRDWNTRNKGFLGNQTASTLGLRLKHNKYGFFNFEGQYFQIGTDYKGYRNQNNGQWSKKGFNSTWESSILTSQANNQNTFIRHKITLSQKINRFVIGFKDDHELNQFSTSAYPLDVSSYQFYDYQFYLASQNESKANYKLFFQERYDQRSDSTRLTPVAKAQTTGAELSFSQWKNQRLTLLSSYRELKVSNSTLMNQKPENTMLGRIDYDVKLWKGAFSWNSFYEVGSGLELKREFLYIKVNDGQGVYSWIDYNQDGVKDLNEFEIAQFVDQASYIRVFVPSNIYVNTYSNEFNQSIIWRPERVWNTKKGVLKQLARFSDQAKIRIQRKTNLFDGINALNPFLSNISDTNIISTNTTLKNTIFFNRISPIFGADFTIQEQRTKSLLASGFDSRENNYKEIQTRWNIKKQFTLECSFQQGVKIVEADYTSGRNYSINYGWVEPKFSFQPSTSFRISLEGKYTLKKNDPIYGGDQALNKQVGIKMKYNQAEKGSFQSSFNTVQIDYTGIQNSSLGFEMLEGLKPGLNFTWNVGYQRSISKSLQMSLQYNGRKSEGSKFIHAGGMEIRAFF
jgi:hypothetical protein